MNSRRLVSSFFLMRHVARLALPLALATFVASCGERQQQGGGPPPPTVTVSKPVKRTVFDYDEYVGRFTAINSVEVRARVSGYLDKLHFKDGQLVKQGDLLFTIDKRPFQNTLDQARANLVQAQVERGLHGGGLHARATARQRQDHHRPDFRAARAGVSQRQGVGDGKRGGGTAGRARPRIHRAARAGQWAHWRPPRVAG